ncbi:uncharacterized protein DUF1413 [Mobilisporobacter senegalensis]|uniref:Uncharacterized protein DUF1413 n=1 Tax=Mobilisporobacter senegalensis TaxID=1329262 RepID=A0A3N1XPC1_9FIRM|nr:single-stranded DNA-binding protein [Mobilisporobacter senegalensis]ROR28513.1 uncharacterized protein DUF1413 [Mobilisporobacter senegalensis]
MIDIDQLLDHAIKETENVNLNEEFLLKDLFKGYEWNRIPHKDRLLLGILFLRYVENNKTFITPFKKTSSKQQIYTKARRNRYGV